MPRSSSLAITIVPTATPVDIRALIHAAIDALQHGDPTEPAVRPPEPDRDAVRGPMPLCPDERS